MALVCAVHVFISDANFEGVQHDCNAATRHAICRASCVSVAVSVTSAFTDVFVSSDSWFDCPFW